MIATEHAPETSFDAVAAEQARALLQRRIALVDRVGFLLSGGFLVVSVVMPLVLGGPHFAWQQITTWSSLFHTLNASVIAGSWAVASHIRLGPRGLLVLDTATIVAAAVFLALMGATLDTYGVVGSFQAILAIGSMLSLRAIAVPSSGKRTLAVSLGASLASLVAIIVCWQVAPPEVGPHDVPLLFRLINVGLWLVAFTSIAHFASRVIYGLRREVREARRLGQYVLHEKVGEGGMGIVYRATHAMLRRETAVKLLPPSRVGADMIARFEREVRQTARLTNPHTVAVYDYGRTPDGVFYYAMEFLDGLDLGQLVEETGPLPAGRVVHILQQICSSLEEAHRIGLVHRDVKPSNAVISERGGTPDVVKVVDFGLVKDLERGPNDTSLTEAGRITGTPLYLAPEAILSAQGFGPRSDLYAVAAVGFFLLTGTHVFAGDTAIEVCAAHLHSKPERPSERLGSPVPANLEALILRGLAKDAAERPESARAMRDLLLACDVTPWSEKDASAWWAAKGRLLLEDRGKARASADGALASTLAVDLAARS